MLFIPVVPTLLTKSPVEPKPGVEAVEQPVPSGLDASALKAQYLTNQSTLTSISDRLMASIKDQTILEAISSLQEVSSYVQETFINPLMSFTNISSLLSYPQVVHDRVVFPGVINLLYEDLLASHNAIRLVTEFMSFLYKALVTDGAMRDIQSNDSLEFVKYLEQKYMSVVIESTYSDYDFFKGNPFEIKGFVESVVENYGLKVPYIEYPLYIYIKNKLLNHQNGFDLQSSINEYYAQQYNVPDYYNSVSDLVVSPNSSVSPLECAGILHLFSYANELFSKLATTPTTSQDQMADTYEKTMFALYVQFIITANHISLNNKIQFYQTDSTIQEMQPGEVVSFNLYGKRQYTVLLGLAADLGEQYKKVLFNTASVSLYKKELETMLQQS